MDGGAFGRFSIAVMALQRYLFIKSFGLGAFEVQPSRDIAAVEAPTARLSLKSRSLHFDFFACAFVRSYRDPRTWNPKP